MVLLHSTKENYVDRETKKGFIAICMGTVILAVILSLLVYFFGFWVAVSLFTVTYFVIFIVTFIFIFVSNSLDTSLALMVGGLWPWVLLMAVYLLLQQSIKLFKQDR